MKCMECTLWKTKQNKAEVFYLLKWFSVLYRRNLIDVHRFQIFPILMVSSCSILLPLFLAISWAECFLQPKNHGTALRATGADAFWNYCRLDLWGGEQEVLLHCEINIFQKNMNIRSCICQLQKLGVARKR